jgi:hypothetical protein
VPFEIGSEKFGHDKHTFYEHSHIFSEFFRHLEIRILKNGSIEAFEV